MSTQSKLELQAFGLRGPQIGMWLFRAVAIVLQALIEIGGVELKKAGFCWRCNL